MDFIIVLTLCLFINAFFGFIVNFNDYNQVLELNRIFNFKIHFKKTQMKLNHLKGRIVTMISLLILNLAVILNFNEVNINITI